MNHGFPTPILDRITSGHTIWEGRQSILSLEVDPEMHSYDLTRDDVLSLAGELRAIGESMTATHPETGATQIQGQLPEAI
jgi:hypothetical protein